MNTQAEYHWRHAGALPCHGFIQQASAKELRLPLKPKPAARLRHVKLSTIKSFQFKTCTKWYVQRSKLFYGREREQSACLTCGSEEIQSFRVLSFALIPCTRRKGVPACRPSLFHAGHSGTTHQIPGAVWSGEALCAVLSAAGLLIAQAQSKTACQIASPTETALPKHNLQP